MIAWLYFFFFSSRRRHTRCALVTRVQTCALPISKTPCAGAHVGAAPAAPIRCTPWQPQAGAELTHPCVQTAAPIPRGRLRCSPCFTAHRRTRPAHPCTTCMLFRFIPRRFDGTGATIRHHLRLLRPLRPMRSEEHTSELHSLIRISYA